MSKNSWGDPFNVIECPECHGVGILSLEEDCRICCGTGKVRMLPYGDRRIDRAAELMADAVFMASPLRKGIKINEA